jgi:phosphate starvation-inducible protein PhoH
LTDATDAQQVKIVIPADHSMVSLLGSGDELLRVIEREFAAAGDIHVRGNEITVTGPPEETALAAAFFDELVELLRKGTELTPDAIERTAAMLRAKHGVRPADVLTVGILSARGRTIRPKTLNQKRYTDAIDNHTIVFAIGPAGTGKTYLAVAQAVAMLQEGRVDRIVLCRPAVEAGERLGFLPGDMKEKVDPYLRPLYDALHDMMPSDQVLRRIGNGEIEVAPLAFMRGRTLSHAYVILDEAQNTTAVQMKMVLTRMGEGTRMVITGDLSQVDLPTGVRSGLRDALETLEGVSGIGVVRFDKRDVVRHPLVARIVDAYEQREAAAGEQRREARRARAAEPGGK